MTLTRSVLAEATKRRDPSRLSSSAEGCRATASAPKLKTAGFATWTLPQPGRLQVPGAEAPGPHLVSSPGRYIHCAVRTRHDRVGIAPRGDALHDAAGGEIDDGERVGEILGDEQQAVVG